MTKEITLCYNLPPIHILNEKFIPEIVTDIVSKKDFFRKSDNKCESILRRLKCSDLSSSLHNFRKKQELNSKLPLDVFK